MINNFFIFLFPILIFSQEKKMSKKEVFQEISKLNKLIEQKNDSLSKTKEKFDKAASMIDRLEQDLKNEIKNRDYTSELEESLANVEKKLKKCNAEENDDFSHNIDLGEYDNYALIIYVEDYKSNSGFSNLSPFPSRDAEELKKVLDDSYGFISEILPNPSRDEILAQLERYADKVVTPNDNFILFYAGHGGKHQKSGDGYWCPINAKKNEDRNAIYNTEINRKLLEFDVLNLLLISDACWPTAINRSANVSMAPETVKYFKLNEKYKRKSRLLLTSGGESTVPAQSIFMKYFINTLKENKRNYLTGSQLYNLVKKEMDDDTGSFDFNYTEPQYQILKKMDHINGGDFIFIKK